MTKEENLAGKSLVVDSLTVLKGITSNQTKTLEYTVDALKNGQAALAQQMSDYWTELASDGVITEEEKKILYKEWKILLRDYADLVNAAESTYGLPISSDVLIAYKAAYAALYRLVITQLKLFDNMHSSTTLPDRDAFVSAYNAYYTAQSALRLAIMEGEDAKVKDYADSLYQQAEADIKDVSLAGLTEASIDYERYASGIEQRIAESDSRLSMLVQAGSTSAFLGMSVGCPYFITSARYTDWQTALSNDASGLAYLSAVYEQVNISTSSTAVYAYRMKDTATTAQVQSLTNKLRALNKLSSVVTIDADMLQVGGTTLFNSNGTIKQSAIDWSGVPAGSGLETLINALSKTTTAGSTVIDGGYIKTDLIDVATLLAKSIVLKAFGFIQSANYAEDSSGMPTAGFKLNAATGQISAYGMKANGLKVVNGDFSGRITASNGLVGAYRYSWDSSHSTEADFYYWLSSIGISDGVYNCTGVLSQREVNYESGSSDNTRLVIFYTLDVNQGQYTLKGSGVLFNNKTSTAYATEKITVLPNDEMDSQRFSIRFSM